MATRSMICRKLENDKYKAIYCHWDGYPTYNGRILLESYQTENMVDALLDLGNISSLGHHINPNPKLEHNFENHQKDVCIAYKRDRGEQEQEARELTEKELWSCGVEYVYIFDASDNKWYVICGKGQEPKSLEKVLMEER